MAASLRKQPYSLIHEALAKGTVFPLIISPEAPVASWKGRGKQKGEIDSEELRQVKCPSFRQKELSLYATTAA